MITTMRHCDRCRAVIRSSTVETKINLTVETRYGWQKCSLTSTGHLDLCRACAKDLSRWLGNKVFTRELDEKDETRNPTHQQEDRKETRQAESRHT